MRDRKEQMENGNWCTVHHARQLTEAQQCNFVGQTVEWIHPSQSFYPNFRIYTFHLYAHWLASHSKAHTSDVHTKTLGHTKEIVCSRFLRVPRWGSVGRIFFTKYIYDQTQAIAPRCLKGQRRTACHSP